MVGRRLALVNKDLTTWFFIYILSFHYVSANFSTTSPNATWNSVAEQSSYEEHDTENEESFVRRLEREAQLVADQHLTQSQVFLSVSPPQFQITPGFMHGFVSNTGAGNRQVTRISDVTETAHLAGSPEGVLSWDSTRSNHSNYLLATSPVGCTLWNLEYGLTDPLDLSVSAASVKSTDGSVVRCQFHTFSKDQKESLIFGLLTRNPTGMNMDLYEVLPEGIEHVTRRSAPEAFYLDYLEVGDSGIMVSVGDGEYGWTVRKSSKLQSEQLEVSYPDLVATTSFTVDIRGFIAVANSTTCLIIQYDDDHLEVFDSIYLENIVSLGTFEYLNSRYLIVAAVNDQRIFLWHPDGFLYQQQLVVPYVSQIYVAKHQHCQEDVFLVLTGDEQPLRVLLWDGSTFDQENGVSVMSVSVEPMGLSFLDSTDELIILSVKNGRTKTVALKTTKSHLPNPVLDQGLRKTEEMNQVEAKLRDQEFRSQNVWDVLGHAILKGEGPLTFVAKQTVTNLKSSAEVKTDFIMSELRQLSWEGSPMANEDLQWTLNDLERTVSHLESTMDSIEQQLMDVVLLNESSWLSGHKTILGSVTAPSAEVTHFSLMEAGQRNIDQILQHLYRLNESVMISGKKIIKENVRVLGNADIKRINEASFSTDVLLTSRPQHVTGHWTFISPLLVDGNVAMDGHLNGIRVSEELVGLQTSSFVQNMKTFTDDVYVKETLVTPRLDGIQTEDLFLNSLTRTRSQFIHVLPPVLLEYVASRITELTVNGMVNGLDIGWLGHAVARKDKTAHFTGHKSFSEPSFNGGIVVLGKYDEVHLPFDLFGQSGEQEITGTKHFEHVRVKNAFVQGLVDGMKLETDVMTLTGDQEVFEKTFSSGITIEGDLLFGGTIDGVAEEDLESIGTEPRNGTDVNVIFLQPVVVEKRLVIKKVVGIDLEEIEGDMVFPGDTHVVFSGEKSFSDVLAPRIDLLGRVNGYDIRHDFVTVGTDQVVNGRKTFIRPVHFGSSVVSGMVDGVDLVNLYNDHISLSSSSRVFQGTLTFVRQMLVEGDIHVSGTVNGMDLGRSLVLSDSSSYHLSDKKFQGGLIVAGHLNLLSGDLTVGHLDGVDMEQFANKRVTLSTDQTIDRTLVVSGSRASAISTQLVNKVNLEQFASDVMTLSSTQLVTGQKSFAGPVIISGDVKLLDTVNGNNITQLNTLALRLDRPLTFDDHITLEDSLRVTGDLTVRGQVNGVNLNQLVSKSLRMSSPLELTGNNTFAAGLEVLGNVLAVKVNGRQLDSDLLLNHGDQEISGTYTFGTVRSSKMIIKGLLNDLNIVQLYNQTAKTNQASYFISDLALSGDLIILEGSRILGMINGVSLDQLAEDAVFKMTNYTQVVRGRKFFTVSALVAHDVHLEKMNGVDLTPFLNDVVYLDKPEQEIMSEKRFESDFTVNYELQALGRSEVKGRIDGVLLERLVENAVFVDQPATITGDIHFLEASVIDVLKTTGRVNGIVIQKEVLLLNSDFPQTISSKKIFSEVKLEVSMDVTGTVNGYRLPDLVQDTLMIHTNQAVIGTKTMTGEITVLRPHYGLVNQIDLSKEVYSLADDIEFHDNVIFNQDVILQREVKLIGLINDLDLTVLQEEALTTTSDQEVLPPFVITEVIASNVQVEGHVSGIDVDRLHREVKDYHFGQGQVVANLGLQIEELTTQVDSLIAVAAEAVGQLSGMVLSQQLNISGWVLESTQEHVRFVEPLDTSRLHVWFWADGHLRPGHVDVQHRIQFIFHSGSDGLSTISTLVSISNKYHSAQLILEATKVEAEIGEDEVIFTRSFDGGSTTHQVILPFPRASGVRLFSSGQVVQALVSTGPDAFCRSGTVHLLLWPTEDPEPILLQSFLGGDLDFGVFEVEGLQYLLLAGKDEEPLRHSVKVYYRGCACSDQPFTFLSRTPSPNVVSVDLFSLDSLVYLVTANRTTVQIFRFAGLQGFQPQLSFTVTHALNVQAVLVRNDLYLLVGQTSGFAYNLVFKATWNGSVLRSRHFVKWL